MILDRKLKIIFGTLGVLIVCTLLQQGPVLVGKITSIPVDVSYETPGKVTSNISSLPNGKYFLSIGRTLGDTEIRIDGVVLQRAQLTGGIPIYVTDSLKPKTLSIEWVAQEEWRNRLFDKPIIAPYGIGLLIQEWRVFNGIFMGPIAALFLIVMALFNLRLSKGNVSRVLPYLLFGITGFLYNAYVSGIPDLFFDQQANTFIQILSKVVFSAAFIYLLASYSEKEPKILIGLHLIALIAVVVFYATRQTWIIGLYESEALFFTVATFIATFELIRVDQNNTEGIFMSCIGIGWTLIQIFAVTLYHFFGASNWTVWNPSFITILAAASFIFIYRRAVNKSAEIRFSRHQYHLARQIAHDIRSPLAMLSAVVHNSGNIDEAERVQVKAVVSRIRDIANNLLKQNEYTDGLVVQAAKIGSLDEYRQGKFLSTEPRSNEVLSPAISNIITEKRLQFASRPGVEISFSDEDLSQLLFSEVQPIEFGRLMSNIIDNAAEAIKADGRISIVLAEIDHHIEISIEDDGLGMSQEVLFRLGTRGFSAGKVKEDSGAGLGVYHAMEAVKSWNGDLRYESKVGKGTKAIIRLPKSKTPDWISDTLFIKMPATIVVLDDDPYVHDLWNIRFKSLKIERLKFVHFVTAFELIQWFRETLGAVENPIYLFDYELKGSALTGLDVIEMLGISNESILVTHKWQDSDIRVRCQKLNVKILPKNATPLIIHV